MHAGAVVGVHACVREYGKAGPRMHACPSVFVAYFVVKAKGIKGMWPKRSHMYIGATCHSDKNDMRYYVND